MHRALLAAAPLLIAASLTAQAPARSGTVGAYDPPRTWSVRTPSFDLQHQRIALRFDLARRLLTGEATTRVVILGQPTDSVRLDAANLTIDAATDARGKRLKFTADTAGVTVRLPKRAQPGDTISFTLRYRTVPERGAYFVPRRRVVWTQGEAIETRSWVPTYDAPNDKTTWEFLVTADTGLSVLSNGRLVEVTRTADGAHQVWHWSQELPASTYLYSVVVGPFTVLRDHWRGIPVDYWVATDTIDAGWRAFGETPSIIETYSQLLGVNFPWAKYDQAIIPDFTYGGMENVSATTQTDLALHAAGAEPEQSGRGLNAHELAHQWFGDLITSATWAHIWLNEGLTSYMESVHREKSRGWDAGQESWWDQQQEAMAADLNQERPLVWGQQPPGEDPIQLFFSGHVYPKGAQLAHQLRRLLGDSVFWAGMRQFLTGNAYRPVETRDYAIAFEQVSGRDLDWFFDQWAYGIGYPKVRVARQWDPDGKALHLTVEQLQQIDSLHPLFRFPVTVRVTTRDSVVRQELMITKQSETFVLALPSTPLSLRFDEGGWLLGTIMTDQTPAELADMARHDLEWAARNWALRQLEGSDASEAASARRFIVLNEHSESLREEAVRQLKADRSEDARRIVASALHDPSSGVRAAALAVIAGFDTAAAQPVVREMMLHDPNDHVQSVAVGLYDPTRGADGLAPLLERLTPAYASTIRGSAAVRLSRIPSPQVDSALVRLTDQGEIRDLRSLALTLLSRREDKSTALAAARTALNDYDPLYAVAGVSTIARVGGDEGKATLRLTLDKETRITVKAAIQRALQPH
jgi:aminopeptidase N